MGGARNLKLGGKGQGTGGNKFSRAWAKCRRYAVVVCIEKDIAGSRGKPLVRGSGGEAS